MTFDGQPPLTEDSLCIKYKFLHYLKKYRKAEYVQRRVGFVNVHDVLG